MAVRSPASPEPEAIPPAAEPITPLALFTGFARVGLLGFGGVLHSARRVMVAERRWLSDEEFARDLALCQVLPGGNVVNLAIMFGAARLGALGALLALTGLFGFPLLVLVGMALAYDSFGTLPAVQAAVGGMAAAGAGLVLGTALRLLRRLRPTPWMLLIGTLAYLGAAIFAFPLLLVVGALAVPSVAVALRRR